jgi:hypothetical protein
MNRWKGIVGKGYTADEFQNYVDTFESNLEDWAWVPEFVVVHNTAIPRYDKWRKGQDGLANIHSLESYYRDGQRWSAGPHLFVADLIWVFTPLNIPGVHSPSWNSISWGVETVGDYDHELFVDPVRGNLISALKTLHSALGKDPATLRFHKEDPKTTHKGCPGIHIVKSELIAAVQAAA